MKRVSTPRDVREGYMVVRTTAAVSTEIVTSVQPRMRKRAGDGRFAATTIAVASPGAAETTTGLGSTRTALAATSAAAAPPARP